MIRLELGDEPEVLRNERDARLPEAIRAFNVWGPDDERLRELLDAGYQVARAELRRRQHDKCAFCEKTEDAFKRPVEHFRPKKGAEDRVAGDWVTVKTHYWWLTWTWKNLYFSCDECNRVGHKGSRFPIERGTSRVAAPTRPVSDPIPRDHYDTSLEHPLLLDPRVDDPLDHLEWAPVDRAKPKRTWQWTIVGRDARGEMTVEVFGLNEREDEVNRHLDTLKLLWKQIETHLTEDRPAHARDAWEDAVRTFVEDSDRPFRSAAYWALDSLCPRAERGGHGFRHPPRPEVSFVG